MHVCPLYRVLAALMLAVVPAATHANTLGPLRPEPLGQSGLYRFDLTLNCARFEEPAGIEDSRIQLDLPVDTAATTVHTLLIDQQSLARLDMLILGTATGMESRESDRNLAVQGSSIPELPGFALLLALGAAAGAFLRRRRVGCAAG